MLKPAHEFAFELRQFGHISREAAGLSSRISWDKSHFSRFPTIEFGPLVIPVGQDLTPSLIGFTNLAQDTDGATSSRRWDTVGGGFNFVSYSQDASPGIMTRRFSAGCDPFGVRRSTTKSAASCTMTALVVVFAPFSMYAESNAVQNWMP